MYHLNDIEILISFYILDECISEICKLHGSIFIWKF